MAALVIVFASLITAHRAAGWRHTHPPALSLARLHALELAKAQRLATTMSIASLALVALLVLLLTHNQVSAGAMAQCSIVQLQ